MSWLVIVAIDAVALIVVLVGTVEAFVGTMRALVHPASRETRWRVFAS